MTFTSHILVELLPSTPRFNGPYLSWYMTMSVQTSVLENGQWVTRTLTAEELLQKDDSPRRGMGTRPPSSPPTCGLLTRTVVDSPVILWALPIKIRPSNQNDIALIGVGLSFQFAGVYTCFYEDFRIHLCPPSNVFCHWLATYLHLRIRINPSKPCSISRSFIVKVLSYRPWLTPI